MKYQLRALMTESALPKLWSSSVINNVLAWKAIPGLSTMTETSSTELFL